MGTQMNEQIKQLAEQAGFVLWTDEAWNPGDTIDYQQKKDRQPDNVEPYTELFLRKFQKITVDGNDVESVEQDEVHYLLKKVPAHGQHSAKDIARDTPSQESDGTLH